MAGLKSYKELTVWQKSMDLVTLVYQLVGDFPKEEKYGLTSQIKRASVSIPSNIAEGWGRTPQSFIHFLKIARGSLFELETQLIIVKNLNFSFGFDKIDSLIIEISKMLNALIFSLEAKK